MTPEERAARAARFRAVVEDGEIAEAFDGLEAQLIKEWKAATEAPEAENLWRAVKSLNLLRSYMRQAIDGGRLPPDGLSAIKRAR